MKQYFATVPINEDGITDYENGLENSPNFIDYRIPEDEYNSLWENHTFDILNDRFDIMIDRYESEVIKADQLKKAYDAINVIKGVFLEAVDKAIELGTCVYLDF